MMTEASGPISNAARIAQLAATHPGEVGWRAVTVDGTDIDLTWAQLHERSSQLAGELAERGVVLGDRVAIGVHNTAAFTLTVLAAWKLGATPVPVRWDLPEWELARVRSVVDARVFIDEHCFGWIEATAERPVPALADVVAPVAHGICSSGSTGTPKVILRDQPSMFDPITAVTMYDNWVPVERPQRIAVLGPMYHTNGFFAHYSLLAGDQIVVHERFDARRVVDSIERHRITTFVATPTMLQRIADLPDIAERDLSSLVWVLQGAASMPPSLVERWIELIGAERLVMAYGMSEGLGLAVCRADEWLIHRGTVGRGFRGTELRVGDDEGNPVPAGQLGEVYLRSPGADGYQYLGGAARLRSTADGFVTAGDIGHLDDDGYLYIADRRVDMIVSGGANVFPAEVEVALIDHPCVADVVVIGLPDPEWGHRVHAIIEVTAGAEAPEAAELIAFAKSRLAPYKVPKTVEVVDAIPRSAATKVNRAALIAERTPS